MATVFDDLMRAGVIATAHNLIYSDSKVAIREAGTSEYGTKRYVLMTTASNKKDFVKTQYILVKNEQYEFYAL